MKEPSQLPIAEKRGRPIYSENPSVPNSNALSTKRRRRQIGTEHKGIVIDNGSGEVLGEGAAVVYEWEEVDDERFVKLFMGGMKKAFGISKAGATLFEMVYEQMRNNHNSDQVRLSIHTAPKGYKKSAFYKGVGELLDREILYRTPYDGLFFVDINCMFNGDRLAFVKGYTRKKTQKKDPKQTDLIDFIDNNPE